ncbi:hypothetical protein KRM28CT15_45740 [Krasilnikovia sp. M28-CT-15]
MGQAEVNVTVTGVGKWVSANMFDQPKKGQYYSIDVIIQVKQTGSSYTPGPEDFKLVAGDGTVFNAEFFTTADDALEPTEIYSGQKAKGKIFFDCPVGAQNSGKIQFEGGGKPVAYWNLPRI